MKNREMNRRRFLIHSLQSAAGAGLLAGCDKRTIIGSDVRPPSAPVGLSQNLSISAGGVYSVNLSWVPNDGTDITGAKTETAIYYNVYRKTDVQGSFDYTVPFTAGLEAASFSDSSAEVQDAFNRLKSNPDIVFEYQVSAVDASNNETPVKLLNPILVPIQPFIDIFFVTDPSAVPGTLTQPDIQPDIVKTMLHAAMMKMTGQTTVAAAWESLFPSLASSTLIGIKINTLGMGNVSTKPQVVAAIIDGLTRMIGGTFPAHNIIVFDDRGISDHMKPAGYVVQNDPQTYRVTSINYNTTLDPQWPITAPQLADLWGTSFTVANVSQRLSRLVEMLDYIINVPVLKDHIQSGISFSMKNLYGLIDSPSTLHDNMCSPFIPALYAAAINGADLRDKIRLIVGDALVGCSTGGPAGGPTIKPCTIVVGTDPVAMDKWALDKINSYRSAKAQIPLTYVKNAVQDARHVFYASRPPYSLGSTNYAPREVVV